MLKMTNLKVDIYLYKHIKKGSEEQGKIIVKWWIWEYNDKIELTNQDFYHGSSEPIEDKYTRTSKKRREKHISSKVESIWNTERFHLEHATIKFA